MERKSCEQQVPVFAKQLKTDLVLCEFTHHNPMKHLDVFQKIHPGKLVFNHVARANEEMFPQLAVNLDYPAAVAQDGDEFEF